jgi:hypothetical protein
MLDCRVIWVGALLSLLALGTPFAFANATDRPTPDRVARVAHLEGRVSLFADADEGWRAARLNTPVSADTSIATESGARAELRFGASAIRLDGDSAFDLLEISDELVQGRVQGGSVSIRLRAYARHDFADKLRIETPGGTVVMETDGRFRIDVRAKDARAHATLVRISVWEGRARLDRGESRFALETGRAFEITIDNGATQYRETSALEDGFDRWAINRDARWDRAHSRHASDTIVSPYMTGYEELDDHGDWLDDRDYGRVWAPRVVIDSWAPYRYGHWSWVRPWGWTWIDDAPWGFAPFHHGRWVQIGRRWCWWPGTYHPRPAYAPALVAWLGNPGFGFSIGIGPQVGWFPLAPREHFVPRYPHRPGYLVNINYVRHEHEVRLPGRYAHRGGATIVPDHVFRGARPVGSNRTPWRAVGDVRPPVVAYFDAPPVRPTRPAQPRDDTRIGDRWAGRTAQARGSSHRPPHEVPPVARGPLQTPTHALPTLPTYPGGPSQAQPQARAKLPPEPIIVGPARVTTPGQTTTPDVVARPVEPRPPQMEREHVGPRQRGRHRVVPTEGPTGGTIASAPALPPASQPIAPSAPVTVAKPSHGGKPHTDAPTPTQKPRGERSAQPKQAID